MSAFEPQEFVEAAISNLTRIEANLHLLGYKFANRQGAIKLIPSGTNSALFKLREKYQVVPELLFAWYDRIDYIDFSQEVSQLSEPCEDPVAGLGLNCTLIFEPLSKLQENRTLLEATGFRSIENDGKEFLPIGTYASNSMPKGIWLPNASTDPIIYDSGTGPVSMGDEISRAIRAGGFPFWEQMFSKRRISSPIQNVPRYPEILATLMEGVVAI